MLYYKKHELSYKFSKGEIMRYGYISYGRLKRHSGSHTDSTNGALSHFLAKMHNGVGRFVGEGYDLSFYPGDVYYIPKGMRYHSYWNNNGENVIWDSFSFDWLPEEDSYPPQLLHLTAEEDMAFQKLTETVKKTDSATVGSFYLLLGSLVKKMTVLERNEPSELFKIASEYLKNDPSLSVGDTAKLCGVSESGLYAEFHSFGTTPIKFRLSNQIERAKELLVSTDLTVEEISDMCGFISVSYFYRVFKKITGKTTREVRSERRM